MTMHLRTHAGEPSPAFHLVPDEVERSFAGIMRRQTLWGIFPCGEWIEEGGSVVIFDRKKRPICRLTVEGGVDILPPNLHIPHVREKRYASAHPADCALVKTQILDIIDRYGLATELQRRRELQRRGLLPRWWDDQFFDRGRR